MSCMSHARLARIATSTYMHLRFAWSQQIRVEPRHAHRYLHDVMFLFQAPSGAVTIVFRGFVEKGVCVAWARHELGNLIARQTVPLDGVGLLPLKKESCIV